MSEYRDPPFKERWPLFVRVLNNLVKLCLVIGGLMAIPAAYLWFWGGAQSQVTSTVVNGIRTTTTIQNIDASNLLNYFFPWCLLIAFVPVYVWAIFVLPHTRLNTESEVEE